MHVTGMEYSSSFVKFNIFGGCFIAIAYEPKTHLATAKLFMYWPALSLEQSHGDGLLIVGEDREEIATHEQLFTLIVRRHVMKKNMRPVGVGVIKHRRVADWASHELEIETPPTLHLPIQNLLGLKH